MLLDKINKYELDITAIQEMRWTGTGVVGKKDCVLFYRCHKKDHEFWTSFIVNKRIKYLIIDLDAKSPRMCAIRFR
jgi:hypothetical protein